MKSLLYLKNIKLRLKLLHTNYFTESFSTFKLFHHILLFVISRIDLWVSKKVST